MNHLCVFVRSAGGEDQAEFDQTETGDRSDGREDRRRRAHAPAGQTQREVQHDARHARHQHPRVKQFIHLTLCLLFLSFLHFFVLMFDIIFCVYEPKINLDAE